MSYTYTFEKDNCWYASVCQQYDTAECNAHCIRYMEMHYLMENSGIPKKKQIPTPLVPDSCDLETFKKLKAIKDDIVEFVQDGHNLYLYSQQFGNGKTSWAIKLLGKYFNDVWEGNGFRCRGLFISVPMFITNLNTFKNDKDFELLKERIKTVDLVVWDDITVTGASASSYLTLASYIDARQLSGLANIFTGNFDGEQLKETLSDRLTSRIWDASIRLELTGSSRRNSTW